MCYSDLGQFQVNSFESNIESKLESEISLKMCCLFQVELNEGPCFCFNGG